MVELLPPAVLLAAVAGCIASVPEPASYCPAAAADPVSTVTASVVPSP